MDVIELGRFLKSRRDRIQPSDVGLPTGPRRRVPGLRRDEVAHLAGASTDYYTELERGAAQPSEQMLAAIARAVRLTRDERDHLFHLAGRPVPAGGSSTDHIHPGLLDLLHRVADTPAQLITDLHVTLVQNPQAIALLGPAVASTGPRAGFVYRWFADPRARDLYPEADHAQQSASFVADLRAAAGRRAADDPDITLIVSELHRRSPEFTALWNHHDVAVRRKERKSIVHPTIGTIDVNCLNLFSEDHRQRLLWFTPALGTPAVEQLELLRVLGTQDLSSTR